MTKEKNTKEQIKLAVKPRKVTGRKVKNLRREGIVPANVFGNKIKSVSIQVALDDFNKTFELAGETNIVYLSIEGEKQERPVLVSNIHLDPVTDTPLHVDFHQIDLTQKVTATVPVELTGTAPAEEEKGAVIVQLVSELDVEALPTDLPDVLVIDISSLKEFGDNLTVKDIKIDSSKVEIDSDPEQQVVQAQEPKEEEPEPTPETEVEGEGEPGETAAPEGEETPQHKPAEGSSPESDKAE